MGGQWSKRGKSLKSFLLQSPEQQHGWAGAEEPLCSDQEYGLPGDRTVRLVTYDTVALGEALLLGRGRREGPSSGSCPSLAREEWSRSDCSGESPNISLVGTLGLRGITYC